MRRLLLLLSALLLAPASAADDDVPPPEICWAKAPSQLKVRITPQGSSHLAPSLPVEVELVDGVTFTTRWIEAELPAEGSLELSTVRVRDKASDGWTLTVSGGVCNDDGSICLPFHATETIPARGKRRGKLTAEPGPAPRAVPSRADVPDEVTDAAMLPPRRRWYDATKEGDVEAAFADATASGRNLLIDFYAPWCPPCDRLKAEFLDRPERLEVLSEFVLLKADADDPASFELKDRYQVGGYPTLLVVDAAGIEFDRITGFDGRTDALAARLHAAAYAPAAAEATPVDLLRQLVAANESEAAVAFVVGMEPHAAEAFAEDYEGLRLALQALRGSNEDALATAINLAAADTSPLPGLAAHHAGSAIEMVEAEDAARAEELKAHYEGRIAAAVGARSPANVLLGRGWTSISGQLVDHAPDLHDDIALGSWYRADWTDEDGARQLLADGALRVAAAILIAEQQTADLPRLEDGRLSLALPDSLLTEAVRPRLLEQSGRVHDLVSLLNKAGLADVAEPLIAAMVALTPQDFTWHYKQAGFLRDHRGGNGAADAATRALTHSYGDNRLRAARRLAEILHAVGNDDAALAAIDDALAVPAPTEENVRTHRYRTALVTLHDTIAPPPKEEPR
ncbi:MAG: thioredoxin fold domain-containing protein [Proteobacteria bacterium]|nr:thioredoxin fold domain-containing protein [Pseudomonadota bacterium]